MAACDTQLPPKMTEVNTAFARGKGVIGMADKTPGHPRSARSGGSKSARSGAGSPLPAAAVLPERELLQRFRHVYAGKGGWYGHRGAKGSGPIHTGTIPNGCVSKYKREILRKLSKSLRAQADGQLQQRQQTDCSGDNKENIVGAACIDKPKTNTGYISKKSPVDKSNTGDTAAPTRAKSKDSATAGVGKNHAAETGGDKPSIEDEAGAPRQSPPARRPSQTDDDVDGRSENGKAIEAVSVENRPDDHGHRRHPTTGKQYRIDSERESRGSNRHVEALSAPTANGGDESLTNRPLNCHDRDNTEKDLGSIQISAELIDSGNGDDDSPGGCLKAAQTTRSCPTRLGVKDRGGHSTKSSGGPGKGTGTGGGVPAAAVPAGKKPTGRAQRCRTLPASSGNKSKSKKTPRSRSVKNVNGSEEAERIRMTLFSRLSQEAQWAISETRREMGVSSPDDDDTAADAVPSNASDPGDHDTVRDLDISPDEPEPAAGCPPPHDGFSEPLDGQEVVQRSDSPVHYKDYDVMPGPTGSRRPASQARSARKVCGGGGDGSAPEPLSRRAAGERLQSGLSRRKGPHVTETSHITEIPVGATAADMNNNRSRRPAPGGDRASQQLSHHNNIRARHSYHGFPGKTRLPEIASSEVDEDRGRKGDPEAAAYNKQRRIPGVGQYTIVGTHAAAAARREQTFEITPPGYDSRFDVPRADLNVVDDTPEEVKQMAIAKCTEWLMKHFVS